jgi:hypothetical protein
VGAALLLGSLSSPVLAQELSAQASGNHVVTPVTRADLGASWRPGCPVKVSDLRRLRVTYRDYQGVRRTGTLVLHRSVTSDVRKAFASALREDFRIFRMAEAAQYYTGSLTPLAVDEALMSANITSGFNCRRTLEGGWSRHAYGKAIDVNPRQNPYSSPSGIKPAGADRTRDGSMGQLSSQSAIVAELRAAGWVWGGTWRAKDWQHLDLRR